MFGSGSNNTIKENNLTNVAQGIWGRGENIFINDNKLNECGWDDSPGYVGGCIVIAGGGQATRQDNVTIQNNYIVNAREVGFMTGTASRVWGNITFSNNSITMHLTVFLQAREPLTGLIM